MREALMYLLWLAAEAVLWTVIGVGALIYLEWVRDQIVRLVGG